MSLPNSQCFFNWWFYDVAKVVMIHKMIQTKIGYKLNYESKLFKTSIYSFFGYPIEQCIKIWRVFFLKISNSGNWKSQKCFFQIFNCQKRKKRTWGISKRQKKKQRIRESRDIEREREREREREEEKRGEWSEWVMHDWRVFLVVNAKI